MKKLLLFILLITLFSCVKSYSQLMQSNSINNVAKKPIKDTVSFLKKVQNKTDSLALLPTINEDKKTDYLINDHQFTSESIKQKEDEIQKLENKNQRKQDIIILRKTIQQLREKQEKLKKDIFIMLNNTYDLLIEKNNLLEEKYQQYIAVLDKDINDYKVQLTANDKNALEKFDNLIHLSKGNLIDHTKTFKDIVSKNFEMNSELDRLKNKRDDFNKAFLELVQINDNMEKYPDLKASFYINLVIAQKKIVTSEKSIIDDKKQFVNNYNVYVDNFNNYAKQLNDEIDRINKGAADDDKYISALTGINKVFGDNGAVSPNISVLAQKVFSSDETSSFSGQVRIFTGGASDSKTNNGTSNLFVAEASTLGFMTDFVFGFIPSNKSAKKDVLTGRFEQKLGIIIGVYYLGKRLQPDTLTRFNTNVFHLKLGMQYILVPHALSAYVNTNYMLVATNINQVTKYYSNVKKIQPFISFGVESYLDLNEGKDFHLLINLGFVNINDYVKNFVKNSDSVIPNVKLSLVKTFNW